MTITKSMRRRPRLFKIAALMLAATAFFVQTAFAAPAKPFTAKLEAFANGDDLLVVYWLTPEPDHYAYSAEPQEVGAPTKLAAKFGEEAQIRVLTLKGNPVVDYFNPGKSVFVYDRETPVFIRITPKKPLEALSNATVAVDAAMLFCSKKNCTPAKDKQSIDLAALPKPLPEARKTEWYAAYAALTVQKTAAAASQTAKLDDSPKVGLIDRAGEGALEGRGAPVFDFTPRFLRPGLEVGSLGKAVLLGVPAGFILNFMPCVLPVVSLKLSSLTAAGGIREDKRKRRIFVEHNFFFGLGIIVYFIGLAGVFGSLGLTWGGLFQKPEIVLFLTALVFPLGLSLFGLFNLPVIDLKLKTDTVKKPRTQAFFTGFLATMLATPCSGPLLGGVLAYALSQSPGKILPVFLAIGLGMAAPYFLMARWPGMAKIFPKPGAWTGHLERLVGFFLMATCVYLLNILPQPYILPGMICLWTTAFAAWMWGHWTGLTKSTAHRFLVRGAAALLAIGVFIWAVSPPAEERLWTDLDRPGLAAALGKEAMLIDFTADWCPNCKALEKTTLSDSAMRDLKKRCGLALYRVDMTREDAWKEGFLKSLGSASIPLVAIFPAGDRSRSPLVLRDLFTKTTLDEALEEVCRKGE